LSQDLAAEPASTRSASRPRPWSGPAMPATPKSPARRTTGPTGGAPMWARWESTAEPA